MLPVAVLMRVQNVFDRLVGDALDLVDNVLAVVLELIVHQDHAFAGELDAGIPAVSDDHTKIVGHLGNGVIRLLALRRGRACV